MTFEWDAEKNRANLEKHGVDFEDAREEAAIDEALVRLGLRSMKQWRFSKNKAKRDRQTLELQIERAANSIKTQDIQLKEKEAAILRAREAVRAPLEEVA